MSMVDAKSLIPEITNDDIDWVCSLLGLDAFDEPRRAYLKRRTTVDVSACPGSGKTTLVVAKLAILARNWPHRTRGICVLSHTNVAREQIEHRLGRTVVGQRLLTYPHFIGTIHGFANRFLALPWLHSHDFPSPTIDNDITTAYRRRVLGQDYYTVRILLSKKHSNLDKLRICDRDLGFDMDGTEFPAGPSTRSFQHVKRAVETTAQAGYFCHDEMFVWADAVLEDYEDLPLWLAHRFPLVIVDEMQDTFERQASLLNTVFSRKSDKIIVQRLGDPNQRIFESTGADPNKTDHFPDSDTRYCLEIPNSYRFGAEIAKFASPFAVTPVGDGLCGIGPRGINSEDQQGKHAIIVFPDDDTNSVLETYGKYVLSVLSEETLVKGPVVAVGHVHKYDPNVTPEHAHYPKSVGHYWSDYSAETPRHAPYPPTLAQYIHMAQGLVAESRALSPGVEKIASGILELARRLGNIGDLKRKARTHRAIVEVLEGNTAALATYQGVLRRFLVDRMPLSENDWSTHVKDLVAVASALYQKGADRNEPKRFLEWPQDALFLKKMDDPSSSDDSGLNVFRVSDGTRDIDIHLGSIHSVKGQTHLATLLLSTFWRAQSAKKIMPWLIGKKVNGKGAGKQDCERLLHTYVAITRPSHLLCLAVPRSALGNSPAAADQTIATLMERGWNIAELVDGIPHWRK